jgi:hypothetical protein
MDRTKPASLASILLGCLVVGACSVDSIPVSLQQTPPGSGPTVHWDLFHHPLPDIPAPNDVATFPDPTSRTGRRINASLIAPTHFEVMARQQFDEMEGWGTTAPISVSFTPEANAPGGAAAIDLEDLRKRMQGDGWDTSNDAVYVVNLDTGVPALIDLGYGDFPQTIVSSTDYYPNDAHGTANNLLFETAEEGAGLTQADYRPALDQDFDGVLDHPNALPTPGGIPGVDDIMTWYERQTDTLVVRPELPLEEKTEYAVVLTDRLHGPDGQPVRSPFPDVYHPQQTEGMTRLRAALSDAGRKGYYGDLAGTGLQHVAFAWTFTTQPVAEDMLKLRDGLYGQGPFARLASQFPPKATIFPTTGKALQPSDEPSGWQQLKECLGPNKTPFVLHWGDAAPAILPLLPMLFSMSDTQLQGLVDSFQYVDYFVVGTYQTPYLIGDPKSTNPWDHFHANFMTGDADVHADTGHFWISVPKARAGAKPPFDVAYWHHGTTLFDTEMFIHSGHYAQNGLALVGIDAPGHGMTLTEGQFTLFKALLAGQCLAPFATALNTGRAIDLNGDGQPDSGGLIWSAHILRTRDNVRQAVIDAMQMTRVLAAFDGKTLSDQDFNGDGKPDLAGDFDGDGVVDVGGPHARYFASGGSLGGIVSMIQGALDPLVVAAAPVSGTGGFMDTAMRGTVAPTPVLEQVMGPIVVAVPASARGDSACKSDQRSVRWVVNDLFSSVEMEVACLDASELDAHMTVLVSNLANGERRCARTGEGGVFRVSLPASTGDAVTVQVIRKADAVDSYATCNVAAGAPFGRLVSTWEQKATMYGSVADSSDTCTEPKGCQQYGGTFYPVGSTLVAPQEGLGLPRQTPDFRQEAALSGAAVDPADPFNYARFYSLRSLPGLDGSPQKARPLLVATTAGDDQVTTASGLAFARAAGALPFLPPQALTTMPEYADFATPASLYAAWGGETPDQVLVNGGEMEGVSRLGRTPGQACGVNYVTSKTCTSPPTADASTCQHTLYDADWLGEMQQDYGQQHGAPPLRLARLAGSHATDAPSLDAAWAPRIQGSPSANDGAWPGDAPLIASVTAYPQPTGQHDWSVGEPCQAFDATTYMDNLLAHFFQSGGKDLYYVTHPRTHRCLANASCPMYTGGQ